MNKSQKYAEKFIAPQRNTITIAEAAQQWIASIETHPTATAEAKAALIAKIREALPKVKVTAAENFTMACNDIKAAFNG